MKFNTNFKVTLINSEGVCRDYLGYCNIIKRHNNFKMLCQSIMLRYYKIQRKFLECYDSLKMLPKFMKRSGNFKMLRLKWN